MYGVPSKLHYENTDHKKPSSPIHTHTGASSIIRYYIKHTPLIALARTSEYPCLFSNVMSTATLLLSTNFKNPYSTLRIGEIH